MESGDKPVETSSLSDQNTPRGSWLVRVSLYNPYLVIVLCLFIVVIGYVSLTRIPVDILPSFKTPAVQVLTPDQENGFPVTHH